jgi:hypothetical protein
MRRLILTALLSLAIFPAVASGQRKDSTDQAWPPLPPVNNKKFIVLEAQLWDTWFSIDLGKLEKTTLMSNPLSVQRCGSTLEGCILDVSDFFSERAGIHGKKRDVLRLGVMMHHYPYILTGGHGRGSGTYVFFLPKEKVFYLWGDCGMNHADVVFGPFAGDPRLVLKKLAEETFSK